jgi:hypothetical protein
VTMAHTNVAAVAGSCDCVYRGLAARTRHQRKVSTITLITS